MTDYTGTGGADSWDGTPGNDTAHGGDGIDTLSGWDGDDFLYGEGGDDWLDGGNGNDLLDGGDGNDTLYVNFGLSPHELDSGGTFIGGSGIDKLILFSVNNFVTVDFSVVSVADDIEQISAVFCAVRLTRDRFLHFSQLDGVFLITGSGTFDLTGDKILGGGLAFDSGDDIVTLAGNHPTTNSSSFSIVTGAGNDQVIGSEGYDSIQGQDDNDRLEGRGGNDALAGGAGDDILIGGDGNDELSGGTGLDSYEGGAGDDLIHMDISDAFAASEVISGGAGFDSLWIDSLGTLDFATYHIADDFEDFQAVNADVIGTPERISHFQNFQANILTLTGAGNVVAGTNFRVNQVYCSDLGNGVDFSALFSGAGGQAVGGAGADTLIGSQYADRLAGGGGNDIIHAGDDRDFLELFGTGIDWIDAGDGDDEFNISQAADVGAGDRFTGGGGFDNLVINTNTLVDFTGATVDTDIEWLTGSPLAQVKMAAVSVDNLLQIQIWKLYLSTAGSVNFTGNLVSLNDFYLSDLGNDVILVGDKIVNAWGGAGNDSIQVGLFTETVHGGGGNDLLQGGSRTDMLYGDAGADILVGGAGEINTLVGGIGNDTYRIDRVDTIVENAGEGVDSVYTSVDFTLGAGVEVEALSASDLGATSTLHLTGNEFSQQLIGNAGNNILDGGGSADAMIGGAGDDLYFVDAGDVVTEGINGGLDEVRTALASYNLAAQVENLTGTSATGQRLTGNDSDNQIIGAAGNDRLDGGSGNDRLIGGGGHDQLFGGGGADVFVFTQQSDSRHAIRSDGFKILPDLIGDFISGTDKIDLSALDAVTGTGANDAFSFIGTAAFSGHAGELRYEVTGGWALVLADTDGNGAADFMLSTTTSSLAAGDFVL
jgi:Ca2+-binding RTX toxin-like protein